MLVSSEVQQNKVESLCRDFAEPQQYLYAYLDGVVDKAAASDRGLWSLTRRQCLFVALQ